MKPGKLLLSPLLLVTLLLVACGTNSSAGAASEASFNKLEIKVFGFGDKTAATTIIVEKAETIQQFYERASALPSQPEKQICTLQGGPRYEMIFFRSNKTDTTVVADKSGCGGVTFGKNDTRQPDKAFWDRLNQIMADNQPKFQPEKLEVISFKDPSQQAMSTTITSPEQVQKLYKAIHALPQMPENKPCPKIAGPRYRLTFFEQENTISIEADKSGCGSVTFLKGGIYPFIGENVRLADKAFWQQLEQTLESAPSEKVVPNKLSIKIGSPSPDQAPPKAPVEVKDRALVRKLYEATYALPPQPTDQICIMMAGLRYYMTFTKDDIDLPLIVADKGGCGTVTIGEGGDVRLANQEYWQLLQKAENG